VLKTGCGELGIALSELPRYTLNHCAAQAHRCHLRETGRADFELRDNRLC